MVPFLTTNDSCYEYWDQVSRGVEFEEESREEAYGTVAVFADRYGNRWHLIEPRSS